MTKLKQKANQHFESRIVETDERHICNRCMYRDYAHLEAVEHSVTARHQCSVMGVNPVRGRTQAVVLCDGFATKRGAV